MAFAAHQTDYSGTFVYQDGMGGHVEVSRITHISDADGEHERLESLNGARREIIRNNDQVWLYWDNHKIQIEEKHIERAFPALLPEQLATLKKNYVIKLGKEDRVAGFHAHEVTFLPRDDLRYTHKMWAHSVSGLLLKAVVLDEQKRVVEQYAFTQLALGGHIDRSWIPKDSSKPVNASIKQLPAAEKKPEDSAKTNDWQVDALPSGFRKVTEICRPMRDHKTPVTHLVFSDGLAGISVFIEDLNDGDDVASGLSSQGAIQIYSRVSGDKLITVVGEVPPRTVIQVADSVRYAGP